MKAKQTPSTNSTSRSYENSDEASPQDQNRRQGHRSQARRQGHLRGSVHGDVEGEATEPVHAAGILVQAHGVVHHGEHVSSPVHGREWVGLSPGRVGL